MIARLIEKSPLYYYCSQCRMKQQELRPYCFFCEATFSNYEEEIVKIFKIKEQEKCD